MIAHSRWLRRAALTVSVLIVAAVTLVPRSEYTAARFDWRVTITARELAEALLNVALFMPFGSAMRWMAARLPTSAAFGLLLSLVVEVLQRTVIPGREGELMDLIANSTGSVVGWMLGHAVLSDRA